MSRRPKPLPPLLVSPPVLPRWGRQAALREESETLLFAAGAGLAVLDPLVRSDQPPGQLWRRRLALKAAAAVVQIEGRRETPAQLRDALALSRPGDDPGPGGRILTGWRFLGEARALKLADQEARLARAFELPGEAAQKLLRAEAAALPGRGLPLRFAAASARRVLDQGQAWRGLALWLADLQLARALNWERPVPLLAGHLPRSALRLEGEAWMLACASAWAKAAAEALAQASELTRRANALRQGAVKLRGKDTAAAILALQSEDALAAQAGENASDRAARRLFEKLTGEGLVRELTGRASFRLYGL